MVPRSPTVVKRRKTAQNGAKRRKMAQNSAKQRKRRSVRRSVREESRLIHPSDVGLNEARGKAKREKEEEDMSQQKYGARQKNEAGTRCMTQSDWGDNIASIPRAAQDGARRRKTAQNGARRRKTAQDGAKSAISSRDQIGGGKSFAPFLKQSL